MSVSIYAAHAARLLRFGDDSSASVVLPEDSGPVDLDYAATRTPADTRRYRDREIRGDYRQILWARRLRRVS